MARGKARQGSEAGKQDGKAWNNVEDQRRIQDAYLHYLQALPRTFIVDVWDHMTPGDLSVPILTEVLRRSANIQLVRHTKQRDGKRSAHWRPC